LQCEIEGVAEEVGGISADEVEVEVEVASAEEVEDGGFSTVEVGGVTGVKDFLFISHYNCNMDF
jgi:hypothetical protein